MDSLPEHTGPEQSPSLAQSVLRTAELLYPAILLLIFVLSAAIHTIITSKAEEKINFPTVKGPGGKPLPVTKRKWEKIAQELADEDNSRASRLAKSAFRYLTFAVISSFVANGIAIIAHALHSHRHEAREDWWWCGEERVVSIVRSRDWMENLTENTGLRWRVGIPLCIRPDHSF